MDAGMWHSMFHLGLPVAEKLIRALIVYGALIIGLRLAGKRELAQLNPFDLVVLLTLSNTVQNAIIGDDNSITGGLIGAAALLLINYLVVRFLYRHERLERLVEGEPDVLVDRGEISKAALDREIITLAELETAAHKQGFASLADVERAVIEPGGTISFVSRLPTPEVARHEELLARLKVVTDELASLRGTINARSSA